jgi:DNA repair protein RecO (recombination protein O)
MVLKKYRVGETHKGLVALSADRGILYAIAHGALRPGNRLASGTEPLTLVRLYFYHEPVKDSLKVTDLTVLASFDRVKSDVQRYFTASLWVEVLLRSLAGGGVDPTALALLRDSVAALDTGEDPALVDLQFLWRYLDYSGFRPDPDRCASCGTHPDPEEPVYHLSGGRGLVCAACAERSRSPRTAMSPGARRYIAHTQGLGLAQAHRVRLAQAASLRRLSTELVQCVLQARLLSLEAGAGIL